MSETRNHINCWKDYEDRLRQLIEIEEKTATQAAKELNISVDSVYKACHKLNIKFVKHNLWSEDEISTVREMLKMGSTYKEIASAIGGGKTELSIARLFTLYKDKYNLSKPGKRAPQLYNTISENKKQEVKNYLMKGYKQDEIEEMTGVRRPNFVHIIKELNIVRPSSDELQDMGIFYVLIDKKLTRVETDLTPDKLKELLDSGETKLSISKKYGLSEGVVGRYAKRHGFTDERYDAAAEIKRRLIKELEGKDATNKDLNRSFDDILTKDFVEDLLKRNMFCISGCGAELGISPVYITHAVRKFNIEIPEELRKNVFQFGLKRYGSCSAFVASSMGEYFTEEALRNLGLVFKRQISLKGIVPENIRQQRVSIDYILTYKGREIWIEYNGAQHYKYIDRLHKNRKDAFINQVLRDAWV